MSNTHRTRVPFRKRHTRKQTPWLTYRGERLGDDELRFVSRSWNASTWERYLQTLEKQQIEFLLRWSRGI